MATQEIRAAIDKANKGFFEGFVKGDASSITASGFVDDAVIFPPDANMIQGKIGDRGILERSHGFRRERG